MNLNLKSKENCKFDAVSLGEVMLRLDPGEGRIRTARSFRAWEGGGEYNVIRGLHKCFKMDTAVITAFAENEVGYLMQDFIEQGGVDTSLIHWAKTDGIGRICRNGLNFTERGFGIRGAVGCSDRANTAISKATPKDFDFEYIFGTLGVRWLHTGGIYAALSEQSCETVLEAVKTAKKYGTTRPIRWDSDHVVLFDDETREMAKEIVRCDALDRVYMALDYFDASINRISAWTMGFRNWQKALLNALCTPNELLTKLQNNNKLTELQVMQDEMKTMPFGDIWDEYCRQCGVKCDREWFDEVKVYEKEVLSRR